MAALLRTGQITPLEVLEAAQVRAHAHANINAIAMFHDDMAHAKALRLSQFAQSQRSSETEKAALWGVPFALKDLGVALKGTITTHGCAFFKQAVAEFDSTLVQRYLAAGLNIFAKTTSPEFGQINQKYPCECPVSFGTPYKFGFAPPYHLRVPHHLGRDCLLYQ